MYTKDTYYVTYPGATSIWYEDYTSIHRPFKSLEVRPTLFPEEGNLLRSKSDPDLLYANVWLEGGMTRDDYEEVLMEEHKSNRNRNGRRKL